MCQTSMTGRGSAITRPRWSVLYAVTLSQVAALGVVEASHSPHPLRLTLRCILALGIFATMSVWLRISRPALDLQNWCDCAGKRMTIRLVESTAPLPRALPARPLISTPAHEDYEIAAR